MKQLATTASPFRNSREPWCWRGRRGWTSRSTRSWTCHTRHRPQPTVSRPTSPTKFKLETLAKGRTDAGYFYAANTLCTPEHGVTHLDAPFHFSESGWTTERIPLENLIAPAIVIDVPPAGCAAADRDYRVTRDDVMQFEKSHGPESPPAPSSCCGRDGAATAHREGLSRRRYARRRVEALDSPRMARTPRSCSWTRAASRRASASTPRRSITASRRSSKCIASRPQRTSPVSKTSPISTPCRRAAQPVIALPMKIEKGSGGPLRAVALVPK